MLFRRSVNDDQKITEADWAEARRQYLETERGAHQKRLREKEEREVTEKRIREEPLQQTPIPPRALQQHPTARTPPPTPPQLAPPPPPLLPPPAQQGSLQCPPLPRVIVRTREVPPPPARPSQSRMPGTPVLSICAPPKGTPLPRLQHSMAITPEYRHPLPFWTGAGWVLC